ncbi:hypothetical protein [Arthrobacter sp. Y81]|uniref:hypothetical protein n=1 Tax=Arthrobacter sp. Y81 TaxID=2058897 RepID=UPI0011B00A17|nr:hypothetical protein [Arthrobacter sp. Y81]
MRLEDALLLLLWVYVLTRWGKATSGLPRRGVTAIVAVSLLATAFAVIGERVSLGPSILYSLRPLEYWAVFPATYFVLRLGTDKHRTYFVRVLGAVTLIQVGVAAAQAVFGFNIGFSKFSVERGAGLTAGPYELGAICSMLAIFWLMRRNYPLAGIAALGVFLTASRISIAGIVIGSVIAIVFSKGKTPAAGTMRPKRVVNVVLGMLLIAGAGMFVAANPSSSGALGDPVIGRLQDTSTVDSWTLSGQVASSLEMPNNANEYYTLAYGSMPYLLGEGGFASTGSGEASDMVRFFRWHILIDSIDSPWTFLFGLGPSFAGASVDGSFVRMMVETGVIGLGVWAWSIRRWGRSLAPALKGVIVALLVGAIFIDLLYSLRPMVLMWAMLAYGDAVALATTRSPDHIAVESHAPSRSANSRKFDNDASQ